MTLTTDERDNLRRALSAYVEETPPAPTWGSWDPAPPARPRRRFTGPLVAVASAALVIGLIGGVAAILRDIGPGPGPAATEVAESWGDWYSRLVAGAESNGRDPTIVQGAAAPEPDFNTTNLGLEQTIEPVTQQLGEVDWGALVGDDVWVDRSTFVVAGRVGPFIAGVIRARSGQVESTVIDDEVCLVVAAPAPGDSGDAGSTATCVDQSDLATFGVGTDAGPLWLSFLRADGAFALIVPQDAAVVAIDTGTERYWQTPRGGVALFSGDLGDEITFFIYGESGDELARGSN